MVFRQYDPTLGRFHSIDPITHFYQSTYTAFDSNPIFYSDPSGASSETQGPQTDLWGRQRYDKNGVFVPSYKRGEKSTDPLIDKLAVKALLSTSQIFSNGIDVGSLNEKQKQKFFEEDELTTIAILLWEFATGTGKETRKFYKGVHPFATKILEGRIVDEILNEFTMELQKIGYDFEKLEDSGTIPINLEFSPNSNPSSWLPSLIKHLDSNPSQFFIGGATAKVSIKDRNLYIQIYNETSRSSLMLHVAENYDRKDGNKPLSTIKQYISTYYEIKKNE